MNFLEKIISRIYQNHLRTKEERQKRRKIKGKRLSSNERIFKAIVEFVRKKDMRRYKQDYREEYKFNLGKLKIFIEMTDHGEFFTAIWADVRIDSVELDAPRRQVKRLGKWLQKEIDMSIRRAKEKEKEKKIKATVKKIDANF